MACVFLKWNVEVLKPVNLYVINVLVGLQLTQHFNLPDERLLSCGYEWIYII